VLGWEEYKLSQFQADPTAGMTTKGTVLGSGHGGVLHCGPQRGERWCLVLTL
jgi:hypothetical protein